MDKEKREMEEAIANSLVDQKRLESEREKQRLELVAHFKSKVASNTADVDSTKDKGIMILYKILSNNVPLEKNISSPQFLNRLKCFKSKSLLVHNFK